MLGLLGIFGALVAGYMADSVMTSTTKSDGAEPDEASENSAQAAIAADNTASVDLLDMASVTPPPEGPAPDSTEPEDDMRKADSTDTPPPEPENLSLLGGTGDDILTGDRGADTVAGGAGNDLLGGRGGDDMIDGGTGKDHIDGGAGADTLFGGDDDDVVQGNDGNDLIEGGRGNDALAGHMDDDQLSGNEGIDSLLGGSGNDTLSGDDGDDWLAGGFGDDALHGGSGSDTLDGNADNDTIWGYDQQDPENSNGTDFLNGGSGEDTLMIGAGDYAHGGEGADRFTIGDWIGGGECAHISDYSPGEDDIVILYDETAHPDPHVEVLTEEGSDTVTVTLDGIPLAVIANGAGLGLGALTLMPSSSV